VARLHKEDTGNGAFTQIRHWQWRVYTKTSLTVPCLLRVTDGSAFAFITLIINNMIIIIIIYKNSAMQWLYIKEINILYFY
jgi:hypothetical protein